MLQQHQRPGPLPPHSPPEHVLELTTQSRHQIACLPSPSIPSRLQKRAKGCSVRFWKTIAIAFPTSSRLPTSLTLLRKVSSQSLFKDLACTDTFLSFVQLIMDRSLSSPRLSLRALRSLLATRPLLQHLARSRAFVSQSLQAPRSQQQHQHQSSEALPPLLALKPAALPPRLPPPSILCKFFARFRLARYRSSSQAAARARCGFSTFCRLR